MSTIKEGDVVTCGYCKKEQVVNFVSERQGGLSVDLKCFHRNVYCETCETLVKDGSDVIEAVRPLCPICNPDELAAYLADD